MRNVIPHSRKSISDLKKGIQIGYQPSKSLQLLEGFTNELFGKLLRGLLPTKETPFYQYPMFHLV
jgi:hypothetical protein